jgi:hypothetical protein
MKLCKISKLPIRVNPEWTDVQITPTYSASFFFVGNNILVTIPKGDCGVDGIKKFIIKRDKFITEFNKNHR